MAHYKSFTRHGDALYKRHIPSCSVDNCKKKHLAKGLCSLHYHRIWGAINKDKRNSQTRLRRSKNPSQFNNYYNKYRSLKLNNSIALILPKELKRLKNSPCFYCGSSFKVELDHVIPLSRGGYHSIGNLVSACRSCNASKNDRLITEWLTGKY